MEVSAQIQKLLYELMSAFTPELSAHELISRMVMTVKKVLRNIHCLHLMRMIIRIRVLLRSVGIIKALHSDRVGLFILTEDKKSMILKV
jgi:hypothetical protein